MATKTAAVGDMSLEDAKAERAQIDQDMAKMRDRKRELTAHIAKIENDEMAAKSAGYGVTIGAIDPNHPDAQQQQPPSK
jgi:cell division protein FtsB